MKRLSGLLWMLWALGCSSDVSTIDRTQPNALDKTAFEGIWMYRPTIIEADPESPVFEGIAGMMDKVRWEITEDLLIGYRSYELIPYAEGLTDDGRDFFGSPAVAFEITSHFDIQREYNPTTGVETNVISENTDDRPWYERRYMRVDWSVNVVGQATPTSFGFGSLNGILSGVATQSYFVQGQQETNPDRPYITRDYMDITNVYSIEPSFNYCVYQLLFNSVPRCGTANVKVRLSFLKVDPSDDYEPLYYPDTFEYRDEEGNPLVLDARDNECDANDDPARAGCFIRGYRFFSKFGNFRINRVAFDRERFQTRSGRVFLAGRYDLWEESFDDDGTLLPYETRRPRPVIFYNSPSMPEALQEASVNWSPPSEGESSSDPIGAWWSEPFDQAVAFRMGFRAPSGNHADVAGFRSAMVQRFGGSTQDWQMFQIRRNDCNAENVLQYAEANELMDVVDRVVGGPESIQVGNIENLCAAIQYQELQNGKTLDPFIARRDGRELAFTWQRHGDLRFNYSNYVHQLSNGPWGVAQFGQDPETGEFVANTANYFGDAGDRIATAGVDTIQWLNGDVSTEDIVTGNTTRTFSQRVARDFSIRRDVKAAMTRDLSSILQSGVVGELPPNVGAGASGLSRGASDRDRYEAIFAGTPLEREFLVSEDLLRVFAGPHLYQPEDGPLPAPAADLGLPGVLPGRVTDDALEQASPMTWLFDFENGPYMQAVTELGSAAIDMAEFFDPNVSGLAQEFKGREREEIFDYLRVRLFKTIQAHEIGHAVGLRHNFQGSMDPLNYRREFWEQFYEEGTDGRPTPGSGSRAEEYKYSSVMDYGFDFSSNVSPGLGSYDQAAVRFIYGQLVDVWDNSQIAIPDPRRYGSYAFRCGAVDDAYIDSGFDLSSLLFLSDPADIPRILSQSPVDLPQCRGEVPGYNYDRSEECDTELDGLFRNVAEAADQNAAAVELSNFCFIQTNPDRVDVVNAVQNIVPNTDLIYGARALATVEDMIEQAQSAFESEPEVDDPTTPFVRVDRGADGMPCFIGIENQDCIDDDEDGVEDDKGFDWSQWRHEIPYGYCSDLFANYTNPFCQRWDAGWDFRESVENAIIRYDRDYIWRSFQRDRSNFGSPNSLVNQLINRRFKVMSDVYRYFLFTRSSDVDFGRVADYQDAAYIGLNFLERVLQSPEPGIYCLGEDNVYRLRASSADGSCDEPYEVGLGFGAGAFHENSWNDEYYFNTTVLGSFWDKLVAAFMLTRSTGSFAFEVSDLFDQRAFSYPYLRTFQDPMLQRMNSMISGDFEGYRSRVVPVDPDEPNGERMVRYMPLFDEEFDNGRPDGLSGTSVRGWMRDNDFPEIEPAWSYQLRLWSLAFSLTGWGNLADTSLEYYRLAKVSIPGTPDHTEYNGVETVRFVDPETGIEYVAPRVEPFLQRETVGVFRAYYGDRNDRLRGDFREWSVGAELVQTADRFKDDVYLPALEACEESAPDVSPELATTEECTSFQRARDELADQVGFLNMLRRFSVSAERIYR
ncbi:MAG: hypothetical protein ACFB9M_17945 [Myxococcota bacterium]